MADKNILHMLTPLKHISPFDVNMAVDAGYDAVAQYAQVTLEEVAGLVQDAIFSRPPKLGVRTGIFIGGKNAALALDMLEAAQKALVPPFSVSIFADPAGSFTTAAAMVACVEKVLKEKKQRDLKGLKVAVFGGTGVVGFSAAVIAALEGAEASLVGYDGVNRVARSAEIIAARFGISIRPVDGSTKPKIAEILSRTEAIFCAGRAGVRVLAKEDIEAADKLVVAADVNAVPPSGIEGLDAAASGTQISTKGALGIGPLAIGNIKYKTESGLFRRMISTSKAVRFDFRDAFALARELNA
ncbi:MAG: methylenetetrahydromethanopterin dehydrogenase [Methylobacteriaceae bacterium]|nr:methylenetetrahydromethanopterin dehydrogenase [Methylobacteriaceae bacterium]